MSIMYAEILLSVVSHSYRDKKFQIRGLRENVSLPQSNHCFWSCYAR